MLNWVGTLQKLRKCLRLFIDSLVWAEHLFIRWYKTFKDGREKRRERCRETMNGVAGRGTTKYRRWMRNLKVSGWKQLCDCKDNRHTVWSWCGKCTQNCLWRSDHIRNMCKVCSQELNDEHKKRYISDTRKMVGLVTSNPRILECLVTCDESWIY